MAELLICIRLCVTAGFLYVGVTSALLGEWLAVVVCLFGIVIINLLRAGDLRT